ncbi:DUF3037 domain-containing protein [Lentisphaera marina]|uniref:DUF3037 domain-containing protein n=1 Tax=Lentisphaera marina TaxID=1111041 RepID=UPI002365595A|nr:DUF3037 domain-containing protein [Lentisphaera marina]MDD7987288.1 DUF3037 domain-containing protein [Lentisphaera marina]
MKSHKKDVINYAVIRFVPYADAGEFVNVGVVAFSPITGKLFHKLETKKYKRLTGFFPELTPQIYLTWVKSYDQELNKLKKSFTHDGLDYFLKEQQTIFKSLVSPKEGVFQFSQIATSMCKDAAVKVEKLFEYYVLRGYVESKRYIEERITQTIKLEFERMQILQNFKQDHTIGNDDYHVKMTFFNPMKNQAIKPFDLDKKDKSSIYNHGDAWVTKIKRLKKYGFLPDEVAFTVKSSLDVKLAPACFEIMAGLEDEGVKVIKLHGVDSFTQEDKKQLSEFVG